MQSGIVAICKATEGACMVGDWIPVVGLASGAGRGVMAITQVAGGAIAAVGGFFGGLVTAIVPGIFGHRDLSHWCFSWMRFGGNQFGHGILNGFRASVSLSPLASFLFWPAYGLFITNNIALFCYDVARGAVVSTSYIAT